VRCELVQFDIVRMLDELLQGGELASEAQCLWSVCRSSARMTSPDQLGCGAEAVLKLACPPGQAVQDLWD
jgi:hypothetical protein